MDIEKSNRNKVLDHKEKKKPMECNELTNIELQFELNLSKI